MNSRNHKFYIMRFLIKSIYPCCIECDNKLVWFECVHHLDDEVHVVLSGDVRLKADITEIWLRCDVDGCIIPNSPVVVDFTLRMRNERVENSINTRV